MNKIRSKSSKATKKTKDEANLKTVKATMTKKKTPSDTTEQAKANHERP